ncbi:MAG: hypothetical protein FD167_284, partial [bacterium]
MGPLDNQKTETIYLIGSEFTFPEQTKQYVSGGLSGNRVLTSSRVFDFSTGAVTSSTGFNGDTTTFTYNDQLDRLTLEVRPLDTQVGGFGRTVYTYSVPEAYPNTVTVESSLDSGRLLTSISEFDGFLRTIRQKRTDPNGQVSSETFYDALGRVEKVTNPFRQGQSETTDGYTTSQYDALSRVLRIQTFASNNTLTGTVNTVYDTNLVTVTDQAGKQRQSESDGVGRLVKVFEPNPTNQALDQITSYKYDARSNLKEVNQGVQVRTFTYDSLSRLTIATSPESGTSGGNGTSTYEYDDASNLTRRTDSRGIVTNYTYDSLNRLSTKSYSDTTPDVSYFYDVVPSNLPSGVTLPSIVNNGFTFQNTLGRATGTASPTTPIEAATGLFHTYDIGGRITKSSQLLDSTNYVTSINYNLASLPINHTYPSGRTIAQNYNIAGQITEVMSNNQVISQLATYTPSGAILSHKLGNGLFHQMKYNSRLQPTEITLGSSLTGQAAEDKWKQEYNYGVYQAQSLSNALTPPSISTNQSQNNGNIGHIKLTPGSGARPINQFFVYDELNRLKLAKEFAFPPACDFPITYVSQSGNVTIDNGIINFTSNGQQQAQGDVTYTVDLSNIPSGQKIHLVAQVALSASSGGNGNSNGGQVGFSIGNRGASLDSNNTNPLSLNKIFSTPLTPGIINNVVLGFGSFAYAYTGTLPSYSGQLAISSLQIVCGQSEPIIDGHITIDDCAGTGISNITVTDPDDPVNGPMNITVSLSRGGGTLEIPTLIGNVPSTIIGTGSFSFGVQGCAQIGVSVTKSNGLTSDIGSGNFGRANKPQIPDVGASQSGQSSNEPQPLVEPNATVSWSQGYSYDRYGNRLSVEGTNQQLLEISTSKNRITDPGYVYDNAGNLINDPSGKYYFYDAENRLIKVSSDASGNDIIARYFYDGNGWRVKKVTP